MTQEISAPENIDGRLRQDQITETVITARRANDPRVGFFILIFLTHQSALKFTNEESKKISK